MKKLTILFLWLVMVMQLNGQDPHFSQFYNAPMSLNPALTGLMSRDLRVHLNHRTQWNTLNHPFKTTAVSADLSTLKSLLQDDILGVGLMVMNDRAGTVDLKNTQVQASIAFSKAINAEKSQYVSLGGQLGFVQQGLNHSKLTFDNQIDGGTIDPNLASGETVADNQQSYVDFTAGMAWAFAPDRYTSFYAGLAVAHLNQPAISFLDNQQEVLYSKKTFYAGAEFRINYFMSLMPRAIHLRQGPARETNVGALLKLNMGLANDSDENTSIYFGTMHRWKDAQVVIVRFDYGPVGMSFSYDINISPLKKATAGQGAFEMALMYRTSFFNPSHRRNPVKCPKF